jgi:hypothetical protein
MNQINMAAGGDRLGTLTECLGTLTQCLGTLTPLYRSVFVILLAESRIITNIDH